MGELHTKDINQSTLTTFNKISMETKSKTECNQHHQQKIIPYPKIHHRQHKQLIKHMAQLHNKHTIKLIDNKLANIRNKIEDKKYSLHNSNILERNQEICLLTFI